MKYNMHFCRVDDNGIITHMAGVSATAKNPKPECTPEAITWCPVDQSELDGFPGSVVWELREAIEMFNAIKWALPPTPTAVRPIDFGNVRQIMNPYGGGPHTCNCGGMARVFLKEMLEFPRFETPDGTIELGGADYLTASENAGRDKRKGTQTKGAVKSADEVKSVDEILADAERRESGFTRRVAAFNAYVDWVGVHAGCGRAAQGVVLAVDRLAQELKCCGIKELAHIERAAADIISALDELCRALGEAENANAGGAGERLKRKIEAIGHDAKTAADAALTTKAAVANLHVDKGNTTPPLNETARAAILKQWDDFKAGKLDKQIDGKIGKRTCQSFIDWCGNLAAYTKPDGTIMTVNDCLPGGEKQLKDLLHTRSQKKHAAK